MVLEDTFYDNNSKCNANEHLSCGQKLMLLASIAKFSFENARKQCHQEVANQDKNPAAKPKKTEIAPSKK